SEKAPATPEPTPSPTPDEISLAPAPPAPPAPPSPAPAEPSLFSPEPQPTPSPLETPKPAGQLSPEEQRISELTESIRQVDDRLREARQSGSKAEAEKLKRKRDELSEELTTLGKP
ncbi:MAG: hypothetical protein N2322_01830, partial [Terrimicrobiaceae bacterium]|nr:hypothetical protein [Terrimicrobiaceae bacterium]